MRQVSAIASGEAEPARAQRERELRRGGLREGWLAVSAGTQT